MPKKLPLETRRLLRQGSFPKAEMAVMEPMRGGTGKALKPTAYEDGWQCQLHLEVKTGAIWQCWTRGDVDDPKQESWIKQPGT